jgi:lactate dehydrogenase-like 2-hydroxyacid dehydrogenase
MKVLIAERKGADSVREGRTAFDEVLRQGTIFMIAAPLDATTRDMIGASELATMDPTAVIINVGRGGIVDEQALAYALKKHELGGAGIDAFEHEPATRENCPLLEPEIPNLVLSPHIAWFSSKTIKGTLITQKANIEAFVAGKPINLVRLN